MRFFKNIAAAALCAVLAAGIAGPARAADNLSCPPGTVETDGALLGHVSPALPIHDAIDDFGAMKYACDVIAAWVQGRIDDADYITIATSFREDYRGTRDTGRDDIALFLLQKVRAFSPDSPARQDAERAAVTIYSDPFSDYFNPFTAMDLTLAAVPEPTPAELAAAAIPCPPGAAAQSPQDPPHSTAPDGTADNTMSQAAAGDASCSCSANALPAIPTSLR